MGLVKEAMTMEEIGMEVNDKMFRRNIEASPEQREHQRQADRISATTQQIKNALVAALTECGLVEHGPVSATERQQMAIKTVIHVGRRVLAILGVMMMPQDAKTRVMPPPGEISRLENDFNAVLDALAKEFGQ
jgi:hypothetical protein